MRVSPCLPSVLALLLGVAPIPAGAQSATVFDRFSKSVYKVEILERSSSTPSIVGTAFVVDTAGTMLTNYHVVKNLVFKPLAYRVRLTGNDGATVDSVHVVRVDAAHDLAILSARLRDPVPLRLDDSVPEVGAPVFSLGFPLNLTGTVVQGSFSGLMPHSLEGTFHFTGSLNPGMSGGPTLLADGRVVGVNVATSGNQLSYLVPAARARDLLAQPRTGKPDLVADVRSSLEAVQARLAQMVFRTGMEETDISGFRLPKPPGDSFDCSASPVDTGELEYDGVIYRCGLDDWLWLDPDDSSPILVIEHVVMSSQKLTRLRFATLYSEWFSSVFDGEISNSDWATKYRCEAENVRNKQALKLRVVQCWRRRPDLPGLYDLFVRTAILGGGDKGVVSTYRMNGTTRENGLALIRQALEHTGEAR
jgi:serine protease Do